MTDGEYNTEYTANGIKTGAATPAIDAANGTSTAQAKALCTAMKAKPDIDIVYTVGFDVGDNAGAKDVLSSAPPSRASTTTPTTAMS